MTDQDRSSAPAGSPPDRIVVAFDELLDTLQRDRAVNRSFATYLFRHDLTVQCAQLSALREENERLTKERDEAREIVVSEHREIMTRIFAREIPCACVVCVAHRSPSLDRERSNGETS